MDNNIDYYENNAQKYMSDTMNLNTSDLITQFESFGLKDGGLILDAGCGPGRDVIQFLQRGYQVEALDACSSFCDMCSHSTGIVARHMTFDQLNECDRFDGIWACASLVHLVDHHKFDSSILALRRALKPDGLFYASFTYGTGFKRTPSGRDFIQFDAARAAEVMFSLGLNVVGDWVSYDAMGRGSWLNLVMRKF